MRYRLDEWMKHKNISLNKLCAASGISRTTLIDLRHGRRKPHVGTLVQVAATLRLSVDMLRKGPPKRKGGTK